MSPAGIRSSRDSNYRNVGMGGYIEHTGLNAEDRRIPRTHDPPPLYLFAPTENERVWLANLNVVGKSIRIHTSTRTQAYLHALPRHLYRLVDA